MDNLTEIKHLMEDHNKADDRRFGELGSDVKEIKEDMRLMKENHLQHIEITLTELRTDIDWLKRSYWMVAGASVGALVVAIINLLI